MEDPRNWLYVDHRRGGKDWLGIEVLENFEGYPEHFGAKDLCFGAPWR